MNTFEPTIVGLRELLEINAHRFVRVMKLLAIKRTALNLRIQNQTADELDEFSQMERFVSPEMRTDLGQMLNDLQSLEMPLSAITLSQLIEMQDFRPAEPGSPKLLPYPTYHIRNEAELLNTLSGRIADELKGRAFLSLNSRTADFYDSASLLAQISSAFLSTEYDVREAGRCFALERYTASVFHCMRMMEVGLEALSGALGISVASNWNNALNLIEKEIRARSSATHGPTWKDDEAFYSEAATHFRVVKNAWRNHTMHKREVFDEERARSILQSTADFMRHLATRLSE